ncbi:MAG: EpsD family peptidyl-prolyl cis-trans isomerase [Sphingomicrobium sp.]
MGKRIVLAMAVAVALSSCQKKAEGQTVAIVNGEEITASDLNSELNSENVPLTGSTQAARAAALQKLVDRRLLAQEAKNEGLDKSPEYINQLRRSTDDLLINLVVSRKMNTVGVPTAAEISRFEASHPETFSNRETWTLEQIIYPLPKDKTVIAKLAAAKTFDEVAQALTGSGIQFTRGTRKIDTAIFPHAIYAQIAALPPGEPFIAPGPDKAIASVISAREPNPLPPEQARQVALAGLKREQLDKFIQDRVKDLKATAKIQYQPGFAVKS